MFVDAETYERIMDSPAGKAGKLYEEMKKVDEELEEAWYYAHVKNSVARHLKAYEEWSEEEKIIAKEAQKALEEKHAELQALQVKWEELQDLCRETMQ